MNVNIAGTIKTLTLIDPATGVNWAADLIGPSLADLHRDEDGNVLVGYAEAGELETIMSDYQAADNRLFNVLAALDSRAAEELKAEVNGIAAEISDYPAYLMAILDTVTA